MAQHEEIVLWLDRRWKNAIEKHLKGETLQEHLETVLDALYNQLPQREYERISREIYAEDVASCEAEESARTYAPAMWWKTGRSGITKLPPVRSCWRSGKSCAVMLRRAAAWRQTNSSECFSTGSPSQQKSLMP